MMRTATEWVSSLKDLSLRKFMWKQVPMANITNRDTGAHESGMTRSACKGVERNFTVNHNIQRSIDNMIILIIFYIQER